jgi:flagellar protein FlaE
MRLNPDEYDPEELRRMVTGRSASDDSGRERTSEFAFGESGGPDERGGAGEALRGNQLEELFMHQSAGSDGAMQKPYLAQLPNEYAAERIVFDWLEFLVLKAGFKRTRETLRQYRLVDWITEGVEASLREYLVGFSADVENTRELDVADHQLSLVYIARLASMN